MQNRYRYVLTQTQQGEPQNISSLASPERQVPDNKDTLTDSGLGRRQQLCNDISRLLRENNSLPTGYSQDLRCNKSSFWLHLHSFWGYFSTVLQQHIGHLPTWGVNLSLSYLFAFSYCSWNSQGKNTKWFAIPFSSGPHCVKTLHHDLSVLGGPTRHGSQFP